MEMQICETSTVQLDIVPDGEAALREHIKNKTTALGREVIKIARSTCILYGYMIHGYFFTRTLMTHSMLLTLAGYWSSIETG